MDVQTYKYQGEGWADVVAKWDMEIPKLDVQTYKYQGEGWADVVAKWDMEIPKLNAKLLGNAWTTMFEGSFSGKMSGLRMRPQLSARFDSRILHAVVTGEVGPATLEISDQELFDRASTVLLRQARRGAVGHRPLYQMDGGGCVVGHFIQPDLYRREMENVRVATVVWNISDDGEFREGLELKRNEITRALDFWPTDHQVRMLFQLQLIHDMIGVAEWPAALSDMASGYGLGEDLLFELALEFQPHYLSLAESYLPPHAPMHFHVDLAGDGGSESKTGVWFGEKLLQIV